MKSQIFFQKIVKILLMSLFCVSIISMTVWAGTHEEPKTSLKFRPDGTFKIVQFTDTQTGADVDPRTIKLMNKVMDFEKPDLVVITGDIVDGRCRSIKDVNKTIAKIAQPIEKRHIPWAIVFGNHDEDSGIISKEDMLKIYMSYPHNITQRGPEYVDGVGNYSLLIMNSSCEKPIFNIYFLDSGRYAAGFVKGYDWIKPSQIEWYRHNAQKLKEEYGQVIPSLMFFHIPLPEFNQSWESGKAIGERNEEESASKINSGLFASVISMGDVKGIFVGHDHTNDYIGELYGVKLGFSRNTGYGTYGKEGFARGARVFRLKESDPANFETWMRLASDF